MNLIELVKMEIWLYTFFGKLILFNSLNVAKLLNFQTWYSNKLGGVAYDVEYMVHIPLKSGLTATLGIGPPQRSPPFIHYSPLKSLKLWQLPASWI